MPLSVQELRDHFAYSAWASARIVAAASELSHEELQRDFKTSDKSVLGTLVHTFAGDRVWLARMNRSPRMHFSAADDYSFTVLQNDWPAVYRGWDEWLASRDDAAVAADLTYQDLKGVTWTHPVWKLAIHVVNHATHHRGQVAGFLRSMGKTPPPLDFIAWLRR